MRPPDLFDILNSSGIDESRRDEERSAIDDLIQGALAYHTPQHFKELMEFTRRLPRYAPFNCMLLHIQNPLVEYVALPKQWALFGRTIKPGARPLLILAPMRPVLFVFDVNDTEGPPLPPSISKAIQNPFAAEGAVSDLTWSRLIRTCSKLGVEVQTVSLGQEEAGDICPRRDNLHGYIVRLNERHDLPARFATLTHELGHLFCGHLGAAKGDFWEARVNTDLVTRELEAEAVAYLVTSRAGLLTGSQKYLSAYLQPGASLPQISLDSILTAAGAVERATQGRLPTKERLRRRSLRKTIQTRTMLD